MPERRDILVVGGYAVVGRRKPVAGESATDRRDAQPSERAGELRQAARDPAPQQ